MKPIFLHSLFRSGSTYFFEVFRRVPDRYRCYQEPLHEILADLSGTSDLPTETTEAIGSLRHPPLAKPYLAEYLPLRHEIGSVFRKRFSYDDYFLPADTPDEELALYISLLIDRASSHAVLQFCRSSGRMAWLRRNFQATHLYLFRNPWDQWWSYKVRPYFSIVNLLICNAAHRPPVLSAIAEKCGIANFHDPDIRKEYLYHAGRMLPAADSYRLFFALWSHAMLEADRWCDVIIDIDQASDSPACREETLAALQQLGISGIDLSDCRIHRGHFGNDDRDFFAPIEQETLDVFQANGYSTEEVARLRHRLAGCRPDVSQASMPTIATELARTRELVQCYEMRLTEQSRLTNDLLKETNRLRSVELELQAVHQSLSWRMTRPLRKLQRLVRQWRGATP